MLLYDMSIIDMNSYSIWFCGVMYARVSTTDVYNIAKTMCSRVSLWIEWSITTSTLISLWTITTDIVLSIKSLFKCVLSAYKHRIRLAQPLRKKHQKHRNRSGGVDSSQWVSIFKQLSVSLQRPQQGAFAEFGWNNLKLK